MSALLVGTVTDGNGLVIEIWGTDTGAGVTFDIKVVSGFADLRGFFLDLGEGTPALKAGDVSGTNTNTKGIAIGDESVTSAGGKDNNMNGTGEKFDLGVEIGTAGAGKDDISSTSITLKGVSLDSLDGLSFGIRATSVGSTATSREDSVKLVGTIDIPEPPPVIVADHFPDFKEATNRDISHFTLYFDTTDGDKNGDGVYTVKIDTPAEFNDDLDNSLDTVLNYLIANDPNVGADTTLLGVAIKGGTIENFYALDNDIDADTASFSLVQNKNVDMTVDYDAVFSPLIPA